MKKKTKKEKVIVDETSVEDRSAFNCTPCNGEGIVMAGTKTSICQPCGGTGKV